MGWKATGSRRTEGLLEDSYPAYTTTPGRLGYSDAKLQRLCREAVDANQRWDVDDAVRWIRALEPCEPWWVEEPTSPDDILGHAASRRQVSPHAGGVGLCELVQHLAMFDYVAVSGTLENRVIEYVDHLHGHFVDPVVIRDGSYRAPTAAGFSAELTRAAVVDHLYPDGPVWVGPELHA